jgi:hypothetical protein
MVSLRLTIGLNEAVNISRFYSFFEADPKLQTSDNNPIIYIFFVGLEHSGQLG